MPPEKLSGIQLRPPERISREHFLADFSCGQESLDNYLIRRAHRADAAGDARVIVLATAELTVVGYYAVASGSVARRSATRRLKRSAPDPIPMALIGRFALDLRIQKQGLGKALMKDAVLRIARASSQIGIRGILLHAINEDAKNFYRRCGFRESVFDEKLMMVSLREIAANMR